MKYICSWSGGKDSTASIILAHENNEPLDIIVFSEVMFDRRNNISGENPEHISFIMNVAKPLFESWGYEVLILRAEKDYLDTFYHVIEHPRKHMEHKGMFFGFPNNGLCGVKRDCKEKPIKDFYKSLEEPFAQYVGICIDESKRLESMHKDCSKISLLEKYGYTEKMARKKCEEYGLLSPCYKLSKRGGCWFCPNAKMEEHKMIRKCNKEAWNKFVALENVCNVANSKWNVYGKTLSERDTLLEMEEHQMTIFDILNVYGGKCTL